jgi:hypothetical protein
MRALRLLAMVALAAGASAALAQAGNPVPTPPEVKEQRRTSNPADYQRESVWKRRAETEQERREALEKEFQKLRDSVGQPAPETPGAAPGATSGAPAAVAVPGSNAAGAGAAPGAPAGGGLTGAASSGASLGLDAVPLKLDTQSPVPPPGPGAKQLKRGVKKAIITTPAAGEEAPPPEAQPQVFAVSPAAMQLAAQGLETAVPLGSYVKARVLTGVEANSQDAYPILLQLDYAFVGPNHTRIDLSHCFVIAKAKANLSTERVMGETQEISCVRRDKEIVTRVAKGYVAGEDSTFGITGQLISHQGQVLVAAVLASLAKSVGEAVALAQTSTEIATGGVGGVATAQNITGNKALYVAGKAVTEPAAMIADWYLNYAKQLVPSIAIGSGRDVWIVLLDTVKVPELDVDDERGM